MPPGRPFSTSTLTRRAAILGSGGALAAATGAGAQTPARITGPFPPVLATPDRVIRTVVGLRPFRRSGYRLAVEQLARRTVVHNYGHGGGGVTLSWGCAEIAARLASEAGRERIAVLGAGVMGLTTALLLARRGHEVRLYAEALPPEVTSNIAGASWYPSLVFDEDAVDDAFLERFARIAAVSHRAFQHMVNDPRYGVTWMRYLRLSWSLPSPERQARGLTGGDALYPGLRREIAPERYFGAAWTQSYFSLMIDSDQYMRALLSDAENAGVRLEQRRFDDIDEVFRLRERVIVNCTGLGARALFGDEELEPRRGQLTFLLPQSDIAYGYSTGTREFGSLYMFPRRSAIVLGGSSQRSDNLAVDEAETARKLAGHALLADRARAAMRVAAEEERPER